jgi:protein TonB
MEEQYREDRRHTIIAFLITGVLYLAAGGIVWYLQRQIALSYPHQQTKKTDLRLSSFVPEVPHPVQPLNTPTEPVTEEKVPKENVQTPKSEQKHPPDNPSKPTERPVIEEEIPAEKTLPKISHNKVSAKQKPKHKIHKRKSRKLSRKKSKKTITKKRLAHHPKQRKKTAAKTTQLSAAQPLNRAKKSAFLAMVRQRIERHKHYPRIAKKRGMQGSVKLRFVILPDGSVKIISATGGTLFVRSAKEALKAAFPIPAEHAPISLPTTVNLTLRYRLR